MFKFQKALLESKNTDLWDLKLRILNGLTVVDYAYRSQQIYVLRTKLKELQNLNVNSIKGMDKF